jgi:hypothetical protein
MVTLVIASWDSIRRLYIIEVKVAFIYNLSIEVSLYFSRMEFNSLV